MTLILRKIHKHLWDDSIQPEWLRSGAVQADSLTSKDLKTDNNKLSVWEVDDKSYNLDFIVAGMASKCDDISNFDYVLFEMKFILKLGIKVIPAEGESLDDQANKDWHRHLIELSGDKLLELARVILYKRNEIRRILPNQVKKKIAESNEAGRLDRSQMKLKVKTKIERLKTE